MQVYVGETRKLSYVANLRDCGWGRIWTVGTPACYPREPWAFDNGAYSHYLQTKKFPEDEFLRRVERAQQRIADPESSVGLPRMAVLPDFVGRGMRSVEFSLEWFDRLPKEWPWYLAVQDRCTIQEIIHALTGKWVESGEPIPPFKIPIAGIFLGGTNEFKKTGGLWASFAKRTGIGFHYGRAGTPRKVRYVRMIHEEYPDLGISCDSSLPLLAAEHWRRFHRAIQEPITQQEFRIGIQECLP